MARLNLIIISAGALGREVHNWATHVISAGASWSIKGFLDDRQGILRALPLRPPILASVEDYEVQPDDVFLCAIGDPAQRRKYQEIIEQKGGLFTTLIHPTALVGVNTVIGPGSIICPLCHVSCDVQMGRSVFFGTLSNTAHDTSYGDFCQVSGSCEINGGAALGNGVFLGSHCTILPSVRLGDWCYVGAHSVVLKRVQSFAKVFGVPAVSIGTVAQEHSPFDDDRHAN